MAIMPRSFLRPGLPPAANLATVRGGRFRGLAPRVRIDLGVQHEDVHVAAGSEDVVQPAEADVVGPAVAPEAPNAPADEVAGRGQQVLRLRSADLGQPAEFGHAGPLLADLSSVSCFARPERLPGRRPVAGRAGPRACGSSSVAGRPPGGSPCRTRHSPRTASWTRPGRGPARPPCRACRAGCHRRSKSSPWRCRPACGRRRTA